MKNIDRILKINEIDVEKYFLSCLFIDNDKIAFISSLVKDYMFSLEANSRIYSILIKLFSNKNSITEATVWNEIEFHSYNTAALTKDYLNFIINGSGHEITGKRAKQYADIIVTNYANREAKKLHLNAINNLEAKKMTIKQIFDIENKIVNKIINFNKLDTVSRVAVNIDNIKKDIIYRVETNQVCGFTTAINELDFKIDGLPRHTLTSIVGESGSGKSFMGLQISYSNALLGKKSFYGSFEMSKEQLSQRLACLAIKFDSNILKNPKQFITRGIYEGQFKDYQEGIDYICSKIEKGNKIISDLPIYIYENTSATIDDFICACGKFRMQEGQHDIIIIDHAELLVPNMQERIPELYNIYKKSKNLAKTENAAIICLHQFNNEVNNSKDRFPNLKSIMGGAAAKQNSDIILMLYRPGIYSDLVKEKPELKDVCQIIVEKIRDLRKPDHPIDVNFSYNGFSDKIEIKTDLANIDLNI